MGDTKKNNKDSNKLLGYQMKDIFIKYILSILLKSSTWWSSSKVIHQSGMVFVIFSLGTSTCIWDNWWLAGCYSILNQKFQFRNPKIYSFRKFSKGNQKSYKHFSEKDFNWRGDITDTSLHVQVKFHSFNPSCPEQNMLQKKD